MGEFKGVRVGRGGGQHGEQTLEDLSLRSPLRSKARDRTKSVGTSQ